MGMYNEVWANCPKCPGQGYMQIPQVVLGFGNFHVDDPSTFEDLEFDKILDIDSLIAKEMFYCQSCSFAFNPVRDRREQIARERGFL